MLVPAQRLPLDQLPVDALAARQGCKHAKDRLLRNVAKLVTALARKLALPSGEPVCDLEQAGFEGVLWAVESWQPDKGAFSTWAHRGAWGFMLNHCRRMLPLVGGLPRVQRGGEYATARAQRVWYDPTRDFGLVLTDERALDVTVLLQQESERRLLHEALAELDHPHAEVLRRQLAGGRLQDIADDLGITRQAVQRRAVAALRCLVAALRPDLDDLQVARRVRDLARWTAP